MTEETVRYGIASMNPRQSGKVYATVLDAVKKALSKKAQRLEIVMIPSWEEVKKERLSTLKSPEVVGMREILGVICVKEPDWSKVVLNYDSLVERLETDLNKKEG